MVVNARIFVGVAGLAGNRIGVRASAASHKIGDAAVFVTLVIVDVAVEYNEAGASVLLALLEEFRQLQFFGPRGVPASISFFIRRTRVRRMVEDEENEVDVNGELLELGT